MFGIGTGELVVIAAILATTGFWVWMVIDCLQNEEDNKLVWLLVLLFLHVLGAVIYWGMRYRPRRLAR
jgi:metal-dependent HD superfamily phosphatase/phosphodiesterase